ncbi:MAG: hypothetical protein BWY15_00894 [Firmicutes bacterium ADurb.Bin193]|nr:MAG: hypothetical protein BWY15_00894 [Firmicutes bacterium ADurb.Bin193]
MTVNYRTKKLILAVLILVCFALLAVTGHSSESIRIVRCGENRTTSLFSGGVGDCFICLPNERCVETVSVRNSAVLPMFYSGVNIENEKCCDVPGEVRAGVYTSLEIVLSTNKSDGKK